MIQHLKVINFQCVREFDEDLAPGVNVFMGKSGLGKSARAIRSLKWLRFNRPLGESFRRWGSKETSVEIETEDGDRVARVKSDSSNLYKLNDLVFKSFGQSPPDEILKALNLGDINFQFQHDPLFLLSMNPVELSKVLNEIVGLDDIDTSRKMANSQIYQERQRLSAQSSLKKKLEEDLEKYKYLDALDLEYQVVEQLREQSSKERSKHKDISFTYTKWSEASAALDKYKDLATACKLIAAAKVWGERSEEAFGSSRNLRNYCEVLNRASGELKKYKSLDSALGRIIKSEETIAFVSKGIEEMRRSHTEILDLHEKWLYACDTFAHLDFDYKELHTEFDRLMPEVCPLCGRRMP